MFSRRSFVISASAATTSLLKAPSARAQIVTSDMSNSTQTDILGIDCHTYPGDQAIEVLQSKYGFRVTGFYLTHAPGKPDKTWLVKRDFLSKNSWGMFPIYLGSQSDAPSEQNGTQHGKEAAALMGQAGFPTGSVVYLDIETPKPADGAFEKYIVSWMTAVRQQGFYPGVYGSYVMVSWLSKLSNAVWTVELPFAKSRLQLNSTTSEELSSSLAYDPSKNPHGIIRTGCVATQYKWYQTFEDLKLDPGVPNVFDLNWSKVADPSNAASIADQLRIPKLS